VLFSEVGRSVDAGGVSRWEQNLLEFATKDFVGLMNQRSLPYACFAHLEACCLTHASVRSWTSFKPAPSSLLPT